MKANIAADPSENLPDAELIAHISTFLLANTDTTGSSMSRILHLLSENNSSQDRLREELAAAKDLNYDTIMGLPFLDAVVRETLRVYAALCTLISAACSIHHLQLPGGTLDYQTVSRSECFVG